MTTEQAISNLKRARCVPYKKETLTMAIKALEQEPFINKPCVSTEACKYDKNKVLDEIRTEIEQLPTQTRTNWNGCCPDIDYPEIEYVDVTKHKLLSIIDKYKAESEE